VDYFREARLAELAGQELAQSGLRPPTHKALLLQHQSALRQLALQHAGSRLHLAQFEVVDELGQKLVEVEAVGLLENELESPHSVLELVTLERLALDLVNPGQDLLEANL